MTCVVRLYVEDIDIGEGKYRQVVSGLAKFLTLEEMQACFSEPQFVSVCSLGLSICISCCSHFGDDSRIAFAGSQSSCVKQCETWQCAGCALIWPGEVTHLRSDVLESLVLLCSLLGNLSKKMCSDSEPQVLCASNEDHTKVEPVAPPAGAAIGERVTFEGLVSLISRAPTLDHFLQLT